jgi:hypothetical protein
VGDFDAILKCAIGGAYDSALQILEYTKGVEGVFNEAYQRIGSKVTYKCQGEVSAASESDLIDALAAFASWAAQDNNDFSITTGSGMIEQLLFADCPTGIRVKFDYEPEQGGRCRKVSFSVEGQQKGSAVAGLLSFEYKTSLDRNLEGLSTIVQSGHVVTDGTLSASDYFLDHIPAGPGGIVQRTLRVQANETTNDATFEVRYSPLLTAYPATSGTVIDGERTISTSYDEHNRQVTTNTYDYVGPGASAYVTAQCTALRAAGELMRAEITTTTHKTARATGRFEVLACRDNSNILELVERTSHGAAGPLLRELRYMGLSPVILQADPSVFIYEQSGRAIGKAVYPMAPPYKFDNSALMEAPEVVLERTNDGEYSVSWRYRFMYAVAHVMVLPSARTDSSGVYTT